MIHFNQIYVGQKLKNTRLEFPRLGNFSREISEVVTVKKKNRKSIVIVDAAGKQTKIGFWTLGGDNYGWSYGYQLDRAE